MSRTSSSILLASLAVVLVALLLVAPRPAAASVVIDLRGTLDLTANHGRSDEAMSLYDETKGEEVVEIAMKYLGVPYVWGGGGPRGFDCSGLVKYVFAQVGVDLPHSSAKQYGYGTYVARNDLRPGDLVFFYSPVHHVGICIGGGKMIDARGSKVRIDSVGWRSYQGARRIFDLTAPISLATSDPPE